MTASPLGRSGPTAQHPGALDDAGRRGAARPLRVAVVHSFYASGQPSGENRVVEQQVAALERAGMDVKLVAQETDVRSGRRLYPLHAALTVASGRGPSPLDEVRAFAADVVHVHNLFPNFGRSWVSRWHGPLVATLHNYRPLCPAATFYRDGKVCTDCLDKRSALPALEHGCYRGRMQTLPLAVSTRFGADPLLDRADQLVALSPLAAELYEASGVPAARLRTVTNFLPDPGPPGPGGDEWLFAGRFVPEKGVLELIREWPSDRRLTLVGDGPLRGVIEAAAGPNVTLLGTRPAAEVRRLMSRARGLVFPSRWFEGSPMVYLEAIAAGTPVLAWRPSAVAELVERDGTGLVVEDLRTALDEADVAFPSMRTHCRAAFDRSYTEASWTRTMQRLYREVAETRTATTAAGLIPRQAGVSVGPRSAAAR